MMCRQTFFDSDLDSKPVLIIPGHYGKGPNTHFSDASENESTDAWILTKAIFYSGTNLNL